MQNSSQKIDDYDYSLPIERIAFYPLEQRDQSKLLVYNKGTITESKFSHLASNLLEDDLLIFNNTAVIPARLHFKNDTAATIEIFCLEPIDSTIENGLTNQSSTTWKCLVGKLQKWKQPTLTLQKNELIFHAKIVNKTKDEIIIHFEWNSPITFAEVLQVFGNAPLPPYIKRSANIADTAAYQTIFAAKSGSVAAPTASLHFTKNIFSELTSKNIQHGFLTLHVGAGTFLPIKTAFTHEHIMHAEWVEVSLDLINKIRAAKNRIIAVGTTSLRSLESIYWIGVRLLENKPIDQIEQWEIYEKSTWSVADSLTAIEEYLQKNDKLIFQTKIMIQPSYSFKIVNGLITNFHQPKSTLLLLVAAMIGDDWKKIYDYAFQHDFRFLSYGDGSLIIR